MRTTSAAAAFALMFAATPASAQRADAVLLVNSRSVHYADAQHYIRPYLDHFGVPYVVLDIATTNVGPEIADYSLIVIGHAALDADNLYLDPAEQANLSSAVLQGTGLVNFDPDVTADGTTARYQFVQDVFGFGYQPPGSGNGAVFTADAPNHYVASRHGAGEVIPAQSMTSATLTPSAGAVVLAEVQSSGSPLVVVTSYGAGRAVQWASYDWMSVSVLGPLHGLDDLVWRGMAWAARKPFVMRGLPNFLTMRVDDVIGGLWWVHVANELQLRPWLGVFYHSVSEADAYDLANLVNDGLATASVHARTVNDFFYYDHSGQRDYPDSTITSFFEDATSWHSAHGIPISKMVLPHYYEFGTNVFGGLRNWGVQFVGTHMDPGTPYGDPWLMRGPYRLFESGPSRNALPGTYADYLAVPGHPEFSNQFFDCVTEIRDDAGYEWYPSSTDVAGTIGRGTRQTRRAFDSMALATLFTHENYVQPFTPDNWRSTLSGIIGNVASYKPIYVTMDYACQYLRAKHDSRMTASRFDPATQILTTDFAGAADLPTQFFVFTSSGDSIVQQAANVPAFSGGTRVTQQLGMAPTLWSIDVTPANPTVAPGTTQQFNATGIYSDTSTKNMAGQASWASSSTSAATIDAGGLATAVAPGVTTISATVGGLSASTTLTVKVAPVTVTTASLPGGTQGAAYGAALAAAGGLPPYTWSLSSGVLPTGLGLSATGVISGTPTVAGTFGFTVMATDSAAESASRSLSLTVFSSGEFTIWPGTAAPANADAGADSAVELGVKFRSEVSGSILGVRFYKAGANTGTHVGNLWTSTGTLLASATFTGESTFGWQQVRFATPVSIAANTLYVASYHTDVGHYSRDLTYFATAGVDRPPLHAPSSAFSGGNGVYRYGTGGAFPSLTSNATNYWVDVVFSGSSQTAPPLVITGVGATAIGTTTATVVWTTDKPADSLVEYGGAIGAYGLTTQDAAMVTSHSVALSGLSPGTTYHYRVTSRDAAGDVATSGDLAFTAAAIQVCPCTIWSASSTPGTTSHTDTAAVELGVKFRSDVAGYVTGIRFYKGIYNTGTHVGHLWAQSGTQLATATFSGETASGWQQVDLATPVVISANTTYVASYYAPIGRYARDLAYFAGSGVDNGVLHALADGVDGGNGVYRYGAGGGFPSLSYNSTNYWVDVVFTTAADTTPPVISTVSATAVGLTSATILWTTDEAADSQVEYGTTTAYGSSTPLDAARVTSHSVALSGLAPGTQYHYRVKSNDAAGNLATSGDFVFTTAADTTPPVISTVSATAVGLTSATILWTTDEVADSQVEYGTTTAYGSVTPRDATRVTSHSVALSGLAPSTQYHYRVKSKDAAGNLATSGDFVFTTAADTTPPVITGVRATSIEPASATILWTTDEAADSQVEYGTTTAYGSSTPLNTTRVTSHSVALTGLSSKTQYHYRVRSRDAAGNLAISADSVFTTARRKH